MLLLQWAQSKAFAINDDAMSPITNALISQTANYARMCLNEMNYRALVILVPFVAPTRLRPDPYRQPS